MSGQVAYTLPDIPPVAALMTRGLQRRSPMPPMPDPHTAVWTGSEMIVWGGSAGRPVFQHRRKIQPQHRQLDSHQHHQRARRPTVSHGSVDRQRNDRLGRTIDGPAVLNTGGRYNPSTDSWTATSTTNAPDARYSHTAVWTGSEMIVWGGDDGINAFEHRREIQSQHGQLDGYEHHQRAHCPSRSHGGVDRQRNDRLGRNGRSITFEHRREIQSRHR